MDWKHQLSWLVCITLITAALTAAQAPPAAGFGLLLQGQGHIPWDEDVIHGPETRDFDLDGVVDLVEKIGNTYRVLDLDGQERWAYTVDPSVLCAGCSDQSYADHYFKGFFHIEPGVRVLVIKIYQSPTPPTKTSIQGALLVPLLAPDEFIYLSGRDLDSIVDLDGDGIHEVLMNYQAFPNTETTWEVWAHDAPVDAPVASRTLLQLEQNHPNPFNPHTSIRFHLSQASEVGLRIHDLAGRRILQRDLGSMDSGTHEFLWSGLDSDGRRVASGVYFYSVTADGDRQIRKMVMVK